MRITGDGGVSRDHLVVRCIDEAWFVENLSPNGLRLRRNRREVLVTRPWRLHDRDELRLGASTRLRFHELLPPGHEGYPPDETDVLDGPAASTLPALSGGELRLVCAVAEAVRAKQPTPSNEALAATLYVGLKTIGTHLSHIYEKWDLAKDLPKETKRQELHLRAESYLEREEARRKRLEGLEP